MHPGNLSPPVTLNQGADVEIMVRWKQTLITVMYRTLLIADRLRRRMETKTLIQLHVVNNCSVSKFLNSGYFLREMPNTEDYNVHDDRTSHSGGNYSVLGFENF